MEATRREAFESFVNTETDYNLKLLCAADFMEEMLKDFMRGEIPIETLIETMADAANQIREDGEDRLQNLDRFMQGKASYPMWFGCWKN